MLTNTLAKPVSNFPSAVVRDVLLRELKSIVVDQQVLRPAWNPMLDSLRIVGILAALDDIIPFKIPPEKVVRKGGYHSIEEATEDIHDNIKEYWNKGKRKRK